MVHINRIAPVSLIPSQPIAVSAPAPEPAALMPESKTSELMASGDLGAMMAAMLLEAGAHSRETARNAKDAALVAEEAACRRKLQQMEVQAEKKLYAGIAGGIGAGLPGAATLAGAFNHNVDGRFFQGSGVMGDGAGKLAGAVWNHEAEDANHAIAQAEREITQAKRAVESASDDAKDAKDLLRRALDHYKEFVTAKEDAKRAALFRA